MKLLEEKIEQFFLKNSSSKYSKKRLEKKLNLTNEELNNLDKALVSLELKEKLYMKENEYIVFSKNLNRKISKVKVDNNNEFYCVIDNKTVYLNNYLPLGVIKSDDIIVKNIKSYGKKTYCDVERIVNRDNKNIIVDCFLIDGKLNVLPTDSSFKYPLYLNDSSSNFLVDGDRIKVCLDSFINDSNFLGYKCSFVNKICHRDDPSLKIKTLASLKDISLDFMKESMDQVKNIKKVVEKEDFIDRIDLRNEEIFTIDSVRTKDMDDAVSLKILENGNYLLGVHITDVPYYIPFNSYLFNDAYNKGTSTYPANYCFPMYPHEFTNGIASLNELKDRLTISCFMEITKQGEIVDYKIFKSVINSKKKMSYEDVNKILENKENVKGYDSFIDTLSNMEKLHIILNNKKEERGYLNFGDRDIITTYDDFGKVISVRTNYRGVAEKIIEDFMLIANETMTSFLYYQDENVLFRNHDKPSKEKLEEIFLSIKDMGIKVKKPKSCDNPKLMQQAMKQIENLDIYPILAEKILRGMKIAIYDIDNNGHYGLALPFYATFTSPIRRFPDSINMLLLEEKLDNEKYIPLDDNEKYLYLKDAADHSSLMQQKSDKFEQDINYISALSFVKNNRDEEYIGFVSSIGAKYILVLLDTGLVVKVSTDDLLEKYEFDNKKKGLIGKSKEIYLGDKIRIKYKNTKERSIYFKEVNPLIRTRN